MTTFLKRPLAENEVRALSSYGSDSTYWHAIFQGHSEYLKCDPNFQKFSRKCRALRDAIDEALSVSSLTGPTTLWAAHGHGVGVRGALDGPDEAFVGQVYRYPGFISTSLEEEFCRRFLAPRLRADSRPTILRFDLPAGFAAIDMRQANHAGEFEILLGRNVRFQVVGAQRGEQDVLELDLAPA